MPKIVNHDQYRKELLMKSFDLFAQKGYSSLTMRQLAQGLGVSTGTLYHYFNSKEALFCQLVQEQSQQDIMHFLAEAENPPTLVERIDIVFNFVAKNEDYFLKQCLLWIEFCQQQNWNKDLYSEALKQADEQTMQAIADYLQITDTIVDFVFNLIYGLLLRRLYGDQTVSYVEQATLLGKMLTTFMEQQPIKLTKYTSKATY